MTRLPSASSTVPIASGAGTCDHQLAQCRAAQRPDLDLDAGRRHLATRTSPGLGGCRPGERVESVAAGRAGGAQQAGVQLDQLVVERLAGQMGADHGDLDQRLAGLARSGSSAVTRPVAPSGSAGRALPGLTQPRQHPVAPGRRHQGHALRQPVRPEPRRQGQRAQIEQVDEVGVGAEPAVEQDRLGGELVDPVDRGRGRQQQHVDALPDRPSVARRAPPAGTGR